MAGKQEKKLAQVAPLRQPLGGDFPIVINQIRAVMQYGQKFGRRRRSLRNIWKNSTKNEIAAFFMHGTQVRNDERQPFPYNLIGFVLDAAAERIFSNDRIESGLKFRVKLLKHVCRIRSRGCDECRSEEHTSELQSP